jgi:uncharacterized protein
MSMTPRRLLLALALLGSLLNGARAAPADDLTAAAERDDRRTVLLLMLRGVDPNGRDSRGKTALEAALREESWSALDGLLEYPALQIDSANEHGETPLMLLALKGRLDAVKTLVRRGASVNKAGWSPLHYACSGPDKGVAAWLLSQGADINARSPNGSTPLMMAARYGATDLAESLLKAGADARLINEQGLSAADFASAAGRDELAKRIAAALR